jgi:hypothetical protein
MHFITPGQSFVGWSGVVSGGSRILRNLTGGILLAAMAVPGLVSCGTQSKATEPPKDTAGVVDSAVSRSEALRAFREGLAPTDSLVGGATSAAALMKAFVRALERNDTVSLERLALSRQEFAWIYYPTNPQAASPYDLSPSLYWFLLEGRSRKGLGHLIAERGGQPLRYAGVRCDTTVSREGENTVTGPCAVLLLQQGGDTIAERLFGLVIERRKRWKFVSYANKLD